MSKTFDIPADDAIGALTVSAHRAARAILRQATLRIQPGEVVSLLGANGAGKSTLLALLAGELQPDASTGPPFLNGRALSSLHAGEQARARAVLPQRPELSFDFDVGEVVAMGAYPFPECGQADTHGLVVRALELADVSHLAQRRYLELSGGEQQRVHFARVILQVLCLRDSDPSGRYLLLDEPTASLDPMHQHGLLRAARSLAASQGLGVLLILHDVNLAALWSDRIALLADGTVFACADPSTVLTPENLRRVYGLDVHVMDHPLRPGKPLIVFG
ncbi:heme ABC transporter ATP-binding protein [Allopusillimonas soli]|uniref:Heme ABC transporter ATP-binding protein n=1 Tax=Allopusillimonas soli TaxID=659016 RepID=A0A853FDS1_9BURK|nr:heme ABC transporter ATP-binding protein [Allopusillimonas soli]NYT39034.1 heme ABC transporter ATP-binding protein [Allopusillimonas soli]TEA69531.1 heme ABC transporter ATP-binding protein [Allopusillimonas soli]